MGSSDCAGDYNRLERERLFCGSERGLESGLEALRFTRLLFFCSLAGLPGGFVLAPPDRLQPLTVQGDIPAQINLKAQGEAGFLR